jgi:hypothetical protein
MNGTQMNADFQDRSGQNVSRRLSRRTFIPLSGIFSLLAFRGILVLFLMIGWVFLSEMPGGRQSIRVFLLKHIGSKQGKRSLNLPIFSRNRISQEKYPSGYSSVGPGSGSTLFSADWEKEIGWQLKSIPG